jgi:hypothetical protein
MLSNKMRIWDETFCITDSSQGGTGLWRGPEMAKVFGASGEPPGLAQKE